ncbi:MAG: phenylalanine--tRNA ligase subunit alpha [Marinilabiliales bacterium]|nr:MAG: phenylalanine--tRNA ligase subunit alpha [Marinilabiliales bacterium]
MIDKINELLKAVENFSPKSLEEVEEFRLKYLSKKGLIPSLFNDFRTLSPDEKKVVGVEINKLKQVATEKVNSLKASLVVNDNSELEIDLSRPGDPLNLGSRHPLSIVRNEIISIFTRLGFIVADGREIEDDDHNFGKLNFPADHPARDMQDTFFISSDMNVLLRTHTSSSQAHEMSEMKPPIRSLSPGRVYRNEAISARAHCLFHQIEGLYVDKNVSFADLKQTLDYFAKEMFGEKTKIRLRPSYFPFTEPSAEMDVSCTLCGGKGCNVCKGTGWLEILGCGMVDPNVFVFAEIDPQVYSGYAFGMGIERITMLKYGIKDLRLFFENDIRFLEQFSSVY